MSRRFHKLAIGLGAMKGASTWLAYNLNRSDLVDMPPPKELHYFHATARWRDDMTMKDKLRRLRPFRGWDGTYLAPEFRRERQRTFLARAAAPRKDLPELRQQRIARRMKEHRRWYERYADGAPSADWYRSLFPRANEHVWALDFSNTYGMLRQRDMTRARDMAEEARAICIMRNPYERLWSHIRFQARIDGTFDALGATPPAELVRQARRLGVDRHSMYFPRLKRALDVFGPERLLVLTFDDIARDPGQVLDDVYRFLDIPPADRKGRASKLLNVTPSLGAPRGLFEEFEEIFAADLRRVESLGYEIPGSWLSAPDRP
ncbi:sulfotransferase domain-containing protein [Mangrovicoccus algicola]|uniref:Sulfotransferase domain-containing protein n=1 Tax=Mangrovicoccus algicola TaxID=2771008 RepID=A0A8J6YXC7_9RHOB|nr:sulfotransferase domain-containing protein [Mangrovicoccus algicola]MBE3639497.1 sulfotransferase domain-containing protein [Mangrovicoccus algicola]